MIQGSTKRSTTLWSEQADPTRLPPPCLNRAIGMRWRCDRDARNRCMHGMRLALTPPCRAFTLSAVTSRYTWLQTDTRGDAHDACAWRGGCQRSWSCCTRPVWSSCSGVLTLDLPASPAVRLHASAGIRGSSVGALCASLCRRVDRVVRSCGRACALAVARPLFPVFPGVFCWCWWGCRSHGFSRRRGQ